MKDTLYKFHTDVLIVGLLTIGFMAVIVADRAFCVMTIAPLTAFVTQMALLIYFSQDDRTDYSEKTLVVTILSYFILLGTFFMLISVYLDGDTFLLSKIDAMFYYRESMKAVNAGLSNGIGYLMRTYDSEDWGALIFDTIVLYILPYKLFLNAIYTILGVISSLYLFRIGKIFMPERYAFLAVIGFSCSAYIVYYNCSFLKESLFLFIIISIFYHIYQVIIYQSRSSILAILFFTTMVLFFRPAVIAFIAAGIFVYYGITQRGNAISFFFYIGALAGLAISLAAMQDIFNSYTNGGNLDNVSNEISNTAYSSNFNFFVSYFGAFFGPFPSLFPKGETPSSSEFFSAGLIYKLFIAIPFWYGVYMAIKKRVIEMAPLLVFVLMELLITGAILASLELRKVIIHVPFMYLVSFYGMYHGFIPAQPSRFKMLPCYLLAIGAMLMWNVLKVKA